MGAVRAGDIRSFNIDGREFDPAPESNYTITLGGFQNEAAQTGNGRLHITQRRELAGIGDAAVSIDSERGDHEFISVRKNEGRVMPVTMTKTDGTTYAGELAIVGEIEENTGEGQLTMELRGTRFEQI